MRARGKHTNAFVARESGSHPISRSGIQVRGWTPSPELLDALDAEDMRFVADKLAADHGDWVLRMCKTWLRDDYAAEDACAAVFETVMVALKPEDGARIPGWLIRTTENICRKARCKQAKIAARFEPGDAVDRVDPRPTPEDEALRRAERAMLLRCLDKLPEAVRNLVVERHVYDFKLSELLARYGGKSSATCQTISRALQDMRRCMTGSKGGQP